MIIAVTAGATTFATAVSPATSWDVLSSPTETVLGALVKLHEGLRRNVGKMMR